MDAVMLPDTKLKRLVIIGGGFGGIELAKNIDYAKYQVVMIDRNNYHTFQPLLYQVATGGLEPDSIAYPIRKIFQHKKDFIFRMAEAVEIKSTENILVTSLGEIKYNALVVATGSTTNYFGNKEIENKGMPLKGVVDALNLRSLLLQNMEKQLTETNSEELQKLQNIVIVGAGPTGVEVAGALAELKNHVLPKDYPELNIHALEIHIVESSAEVLGNLSKQAQVKAKSFLEKLGVKLWLNVRVEKFENETVYLSNQQQIKSKTLIWSAGVKGCPVTGIDAIRITKANRIEVDLYNRITGYENIYAIGDVAAVNDTTLVASRSHPQVAPVAMQQAKNLAKNLNGHGGDWIPFKYKDLGSMATIGRNKAVADLGKIKLQGVLAWFVWMFVHLMSIVGFRNRVVVLINWMWNYFSYDRAIRLIIRPFHKKD